MATRLLEADDWTLTCKACGGGSNAPVAGPRTARLRCCRRRRPTAHLTRGPFNHLYLPGLHPCWVNQSSAAAHLLPGNGNALLTPPDLPVGRASPRSQQRDEAHTFRGRSRPVPPNGASVPKPARSTFPVEGRPRIRSAAADNAISRQPQLAKISPRSERRRGTTPYLRRAGARLQCRCGD